MTTIVLGDRYVETRKEHKSDGDPNGRIKSYWTEAILFTTTNDSFCTTEISYLKTVLQFSYYGKPI